LTLSVPDEGYSRLYNLSTLSVPDEGYSRNASYALNLISMILLELNLMGIHPSLVPIFKTVHSLIQVTAYKKQEGICQIGRNSSSRLYLLIYKRYLGHCVQKPDG
jgi:hypothetical protein